MTVLGGVLAVMDVTALQQIVDLAVGDDHLAQLLGLQHGSVHHVVGLDALAVVGVGDDLVRHASQVSQFLALQAAGDGTVGVDMDAGACIDQVQLLLQMLDGIGSGIQVGHGADGGVAAAGCAGGTGHHGLLIRKTRLSEMHVHITKTG